MFPHSEICGYNAYLQLTAAYRSLSRPSSAPDAKAFTLRSCSLELSAKTFVSACSVLLKLYEFLLNITFKDTCLQLKKFPFSPFIHLAVKLYFFPLRFGKTINYFMSSSVRFLLKSFFYSVVNDLRTTRFGVPSGTGRSGWTRTIDLSVISRVL